MANHWFLSPLLRVASWRRLTPFLDPDGRYERGFFPEIMAGCLIVRNSPLGVAFVSQWLAYNAPKPAGFSSSDNGALHLAVLRLLRPENPETIKRARDYYALTATSSNLQP